MRNSNALCLSVFIILIAACSENDTKYEQPTSKKTPGNAIEHANTQSPPPKMAASHAIGKPSAPIAYQSDYDGNSIAGQLENFTATVSSPQQGQLTVIVSSKDNLLLSGQIELTEDITPNTPIELPINIYPHKDGKYYLNIITSLEHNGATMSKAFTQAIYVGDWKDKSNKNSNLKTSVSGKKVITLPAAETIKN